ncbi:fimbrial protein [Erwinia aphidicola]|uniref:fimbrial protein n=2 Tax=Erwinia aphidicola TaxID=68334 RepID=UPI0030CAC8C5
MTHSRLSPAALLSLALMLTTVNVSASVVGISMKGQIIWTPPCKVTSADSRRIEVSFGDSVGINQVEGMRYRQPLNYHITCYKSQPAGTGLVLTLKGDIASFDASKAALQTSVKGLAIRILQNGSPMVINQPIKVISTALPALEAVLVKQSGVPLKEGQFESTATLLADYQ